jgi:hypothetical protein
MGVGDDFRMEFPAGSLSELLQGTGTAGQSTWTVEVDFDGGVTSQYRFEAFFEDLVNEAMIPELAVITAPTAGAVLTEAPPSIDWTEPIGWHDGVFVAIDVTDSSGSMQGSVFGDTSFPGYGSLVLDPFSPYESVSVPVALDQGNYRARVEYSDMPPNPAALTTPLVWVSGPTISMDWGVFGFGYPYDIPMVIFGSMATNAFSVVPELVSSSPAMDGTLPKAQNNEVELVFSTTLADPGDTPLVIKEIGSGTDASDKFSYSFDGDTLYALENGPQLSDLTWYSVEPAPALGVAAFEVDLCTCIGDADDSGRVTTADYSEVKIHLGEYTDARYDLNGTGRVTAADYSVIKANVGHRCPPKP